MQNYTIDKPPPWRDIVKGFQALWNEYTVFTKFVTGALVFASLSQIAISVAGPDVCVWAPVCVLPVKLQSAIASEGARNILELAIVLAVAVHLKVRARRGLLDGSEHYDIGRALAYGYFVNFLVPALLLVRAESRSRNTPSTSPLLLWVVFPSTVGELDKFKNEVEPVIRQRTGTRSLQSVYQTGGTVIQRTLLVVSKHPGGTGSEGERFFDFPTTLYTVHDYYAMWSKWQREHKNTLVDSAVWMEDEQIQINVFFAQLHNLFTSDVGLKAVAHLGISSTAELSSLYTDHFKRVAPDQLINLLNESVAPA